MPNIKSPEGGLRLRALVQGQVQGIFFRDFTQIHAQRLGLVGWVRNQPDGNTVEVIAEGPHLPLDQMLGHLRQGPPEAYVIQVDVEWATVLAISTSGTD